MILEEEISDPKGDEKVDIDGVLKDGNFIIIIIIHYY